MDDIQYNIKKIISRAGTEQEVKLNSDLRRLNIFKKRSMARVESHWLGEITKSR